MSPAIFILAIQMSDVINTQTGVSNYVGNNASLQVVIKTGNITALLEYCKPIAESGISSFTDPGKVAAVALWALDKDVNLIDALAHVFIHNGKLSLDSHMVRGLLQKAGVFHKFIKNYKNVYEYKSGDAIFTQEDIDENKDQFKVFFSVDAAKEWRSSNPDKKHVKAVLRSPQPIDIITEIEFRRKRNGEDIVIRSSFSIKEAELAGLLTKSNWVNYPKLCLAARAYVIGAREIADDIIFGMYNPDELGFSGIESIQEVIEDTPYEEVQE